MGKEKTDKRSLRRLAMFAGDLGHTVPRNKIKQCYMTAYTGVHDLSL
jgi:hypothetical protein